MTRLRLPRQILTLHEVALHGKFILQKRVPMLNAQALPTFLFSFHLPLPPNIQLQNIDNFVLGPSICILLK